MLSNLVIKHVLAVHPIGHATVSGDAVTKVFDVKCTLESRSKESAERSNEGRETSQDEYVELIRSVWNRGDASSKLSTLQLAIAFWASEK